MMNVLAWMAVVAIAGVTSPVAAQLDSFEGYALGAIDSERVGPLGSWRGDAEVSTQRANTGRRALRIFGGERRQVILCFPDVRESVLVSFAAERWTRRAPFAFQVEARAGTSWSTVYADDGKSITTGGYNATVEFQVEGEFDALRLTCTSPEGGGILIDDFRVEPLRPMRVVSVTTEQPVLPVLVGNTINPIARVRIVTDGSLEPMAITGVRWTLRSANQLREIAAAASYFGTTERLDWRRPEACFSPGDMLGRPTAPEPIVHASGAIELARGENFLWLSVTLADEVDLDGWIDGGCSEVTFSNGSSMTPTITEPAGAQRLGVAVRNARAESECAYRIPGIIATRHGTLLAVYDIRHDGWRDLPGNIDVGASRSTDGGRTWQPMKTIMDQGDDPKWRFDGVGDPAILYDRERDTIWVAATWSHGDRSWTGSGSGLEPQETGQLLLVKSTDDGRTWSSPHNVTRQIKNPEWAFLLQSPGEGMAMADGTLVFPCQYQAPPAEGRTPYATIMYSRDGGATWQIGRGARANTTESRVVELEPGTLMLNMRDNRGGGRTVYVTRDMGMTWEPHASSRAALPGPVCNAGLIRVRGGEDPRRPWLAFVNPNVAGGPRCDMTLKLSTDGGMSWPSARHLLLDEGQSAGYASLTMIDRETIGVLYEGSRAHMTFQRIALRELLSEK